MRNNKTNNIKRSPASDCVKPHTVFSLKNSKKLILRDFRQKSVGGWVGGGGWW